MTIFRNWTAVNPVTAEPHRSARPSWWHYCDRCMKLTELPGPDGPSGMVADSDEGVPAETVAAASGHVCQRGWKLEPEPVGAELDLTEEWDADDDEVVITHTIREAARLLRVAKGTIERRRAALRATGRMQASGQSVRWTPEWDEWTLTLPTRQVAQRTGLPRSTIRGRKARLLEMPAA